MRHADAKRRERYHACLWLGLSMLAMLTMPAFLALMLIWFHFRADAGTHDNLTMFVFAVGFSGMVIGFIVCSTLARKHFQLMRKANAKQRFSAHLADLRGEGTAMSDWRDRQRLTACVPLVMLVLTVLAILWVLR